jgi:hypothetical protein
MQTTNLQLNESLQITKKKLQSVEYKLEIVQQNRSIVEIQ